MSIPLTGRISKTSLIGNFLFLRDFFFFFLSFS